MTRRMKITGMTEVSEMLEKCGSEAPGIAAAALYEGARVVADALTAAVNTIRTGPRVWGSKENLRYPYPEEVDALKRGYSAGVAKFQGDGTELNTLVGTSAGGYTDIEGRKIATNLLARSIESGTSFMFKQPFMRKAAQAAKGEAEAAILNEIDARINKITGGK